jgi:type III pantothenate kinase
MALPFVAVDIGNSSIKLGLFSGGRSTARLETPEWTGSIDSVDDLAVISSSLPTAAKWLVVSVHRASEQALAHWVRHERSHDDYRRLTHRDLPIEVHVEQPDRVGMDRLAAAVGANTLREPHRGAVVVDAGSAVTVDLIGPSGAFEGGVILPGFRMSAQALSQADLLPEVLWQTSSEPPPVLGKNTEGAIRSGLFWGTVGAVREIIERLSETHRRPQVFVTGGDLLRLAPLVSADAQFVPHLVLSGIAAAGRE